MLSKNFVRISEAVGGLLGSLISGRINKKLNVFVMISIAGISGMSLGVIPIMYLLKKILSFYL